jgi:hypothetical protein
MNVDAPLSAAHAADGLGLRVAVLIPCWNEAPTIAKVVADFRGVLPGAAIFVYDNNSSDGSAAAARGAGAVLRHEALQGKGNVVRRASSSTATTHTTHRAHLPCCASCSSSSSTW